MNVDEAESRPPLVVALFGPTGTGKTELACRIADRLKVHLISCDSVQVYRHVDAATAKPEGAELRHPWALVDWVPPERDVNLGDWVRAAEAEISRAGRSGRTPLVVGGTGLYLRGLAKGVATAPPRDEAIRSRLAVLEERRGLPWLYRVLSRLDPPAACKLGVADRQRIVRALEVRLASGTPLSTLQGGRWRQADRFAMRRIGLTVERGALYERLEARVDAFFARGLVQEVLDLLNRRRVCPEANALRGIGYREVVASCERDPSGRWRFRGELDELRDRVKQSTRRYAKRQMTWFRKEPETIWLDADDPACEDEAVGLVRDWAAGQTAGPFGYTSNP